MTHIYQLLGCIGYSGVSDFDLGWLAVNVLFIFAQNSMSFFWKLFRYPVLLCDKCSNKKQRLSVTSSVVTTVCRFAARRFDADPSVQSHATDATDTSLLATAVVNTNSLHGDEQ
jgi:hypothetical protein